ncbi:flagellar hook-basal body complex protein FliE [Iodidimonas gelatinilytica]|uniref:Flagellar hook-basal body complex protein FliE n=2 Tax=Iodidimonas gelatinilytica TaxID=1236966 RepID=A0A5A7MYA8_9PROT|nr:flagellar hook-basal body complex protein FliE [Iodidimonas gelatinilytica]GER00415.1 flagellar hook-basal body complex protein FliE [Iodidimonas gelatinilytica]
MMDTKMLDAANAYGASLGRMGGGAAEVASTGSGFGAMVENMVSETTNAVSAAESVSAQAVAGQADMVDVVTAISNAEMVLETVTTVRDRVISAYQEIMRMPI